jgi:tetratricopeptide (TPR) repeat protein
VDIAGRIRDLRVQAGLTKTALAKPRYTVSYVSQIEAGRRTPSAEALAFFAGQLGVSPQFLATGIPEEIEEELRYRLDEARARLREADTGKAEDMARQVMARAAEYDLSAIRGEASLVAAESLAEAGRMSEAIDAYEEVLDGDLSERDRALAVVGLARAYRTVGDLIYAAQVVETFLGRPSRGPLDPSQAAELHNVLVSIYFERGDMTRAERAARHALAAAADAGSMELRARTYWYVARVLAEQKKWAEALEMSSRARMLMEEVDDRQSVARLHNAYAFLCLEADPPRVEEAKDHLDKAEAFLSTLAARGELAYIHDERARLALLVERPAEALEWADRALAEANPDGPEAARCLYLKGRALSALARLDEARLALEEAATRFGAQGARQQEASCWRELGELELARDDVPAAVEALRAGLAALDPNRSRA